MERPSEMPSSAGKFSDASDVRLPRARCHRRGMRAVAATRRYGATAARRFQPAGPRCSSDTVCPIRLLGPARTYGNPVAGAQAVLAMDYIAGALNTSPRWANIEATTQMQLLQARAQTRAAVGIAANAPSQIVVNSLVAARNDLASGNQGAAAHDLDNPAFPQGGAHTVQVLANLPYIPMANVATQRAAGRTVPSGGERHVSPLTVRSQRPAILASPQAWPVGPNTDCPLTRTTPASRRNASGPPRSHR